MRVSFSVTSLLVVKACVEAKYSLVQGVLDNAISAVAAVAGPGGRNDAMTAVFEALKVPLSLHHSYLLVQPLRTQNLCPDPH